MRIALAVLAAVLLLAGCGHASAPKDPFVGTWQAANPGGAALRLVIGRQGSAYVAVSFMQGRVMNRVVFYARHGNELVAKLIVLNPTTGKPTGKVLKSTADLDPESGQLHYSPFGRFIEFSRISVSTAVPSPSPT